MIGIGVGGVCGFATGFSIAMITGRPNASETVQMAVTLGVLLGGAGAVAGAVAGGVGDILAFLRSAFADLDMTIGPEDDYKELSPPPTSPDPPS
jgi:hypothetical protein